jgi:hypothetical protein
LRKLAKKGEEKKECIMGKHKLTFELSTHLALAGNGAVYGLCRFIPKD